MFVDAMDNTGLSKLLERLQTVLPITKPELAYLTHEGRTYFSRHSRTPGEPHSAITVLIQGIYDLDPEFARKILRKKIQHTGQATEMCRGMVKVAAKSLTRLQSQNPELDLHLPEGDSVHEIIPLSAPTQPRLLHQEPDLSPLFTSSASRSPEAWLQRSAELATQVCLRAERFESDRPVAAILVSAEGIVLAAARNTNSRNRTLHAEVNLLQSYHERCKRPIPAGASLYVALKPCKMCAGMIWECAEDLNSLRVFYGQDDPGSMAKATVLDPHSHERTRALLQNFRIVPDTLQELRAFQKSANETERSGSGEPDLRKESGF